MAKILSLLRYLWSCNAHFSFIFFVYIFIHISDNVSRIVSKFSPMILHASTKKLKYQSILPLIVLHKATLCTSTFKASEEYLENFRSQCISVKEWKTKMLRWISFYFLCFLNGYSGPFERKTVYFPLKLCSIAVNLISW